ncbi:MULTISPECIES: dephospho-CoA kinase [Moraxella]|uniref:Dephospho-CoA kinase n=1 Tax=Moraxella catarrhalis TaxID=480 RepID=A0A7Z1A4G7_MORCA|nr:dephospho-CoA kinase [Moraxella catarrhalis]OAV01259.1 Dephospho-CoA kinase [Moraxella catarrhalis]STY81005.1 Dephospho-CoA kinase [Moraxella catarrhalis]
MFILGLTGGIGSGKSAVSDYLGKQGITVVDADIIAHRLTADGSPLLMSLKEALGDWVLDDQGRYDRAAVRARVFNDPQTLDRLNAIIHPAIHQAILDELDGSQSAYTILSVPLLFEGRHKSPNLLSLCDHVLVVDTSAETQRQRAAKRDGHDPAQIQAIIDKQISRAQRLVLAQDIGADILVNDKTLDEIHQALDTLHQKYLAMAAQHDSK